MDSFLAAFAAVEGGIGVVIACCVSIGRDRPPAGWWLLLVGTCSLPVLVLATAFMLPLPAIPGPREIGIIAGLFVAAAFICVLALPVALLANTQDDLRLDHWLRRAVVFVMFVNQLALGFLTILVGAQAFSNTHL